MITIKHVIGQTAWEVSEDGVALVSALSFDFAIALYPELRATLKCEHCRKTNEVFPESLSGMTMMLACKSCRQYPVSVHTNDQIAPPRAKHTHVVREPSKEKFMARMRKDILVTYKALGLRTTGSTLVDQKLRLPYAPKDRPEMQTIVPSDDVSDCQICGCTITDEYVDGVTVGGPWADMCVSCHREAGIGLGTGRGQKYRRNSDGDFEKVEAKCLATNDLSP